MEPVDIEAGAWTFSARTSGPADGELAVLLHGFPQTSWTWRHQLDVLGAAGYRVVAFDQRGYSPGARPEGVEHYAIEHLVDDVLAVADACGARRFHLVGHDWGAIVAWQVAGRHPERLVSLTALSVPHPVAFASAIASDPDQQQRSGYMAFFREPEAPEKAFLDDDAAGLRALFSSSGLPAADADEHVRILRQPGAMTAALNYYRAMAPGLVTEIGPITTPTLYVWSDADVAVGRAGADATAAFVSGPYRFEVLAGVSHWIPEQAPDKLNPLLLEHLRGS